jgi:hypothetical protein
MINFQLSKYARKLVNDLLAMQQRIDKGGAMLA